MLLKMFRFTTYLLSILFIEVHPVYLTMVKQTASKYKYSGPI